MTVEQYLRTSFDGPDCEYVDGELVDRNVGEPLHSWLHGWIYRLLIDQRRKSRVKILMSVRVRTSETHFRVPDIAVWRSSDAIAGPFVTAPPFLVVEILSTDDQMSRIALKVRDYLRWGVDSVWIIDPNERAGWVYSRHNPLGESVTVLRTENPDIAIPLENALNPQD